MSSSVVDLGGETARAIRNGECLERRDGLRGSLEGGGHRGGAAAAGGAHRAQAGDHDPAAGPHRPNTRLTFCPPKPKEFDTAAPSSTGRAVPGNAIEGHVRIRVAQVCGGRDEAVLQGEESGRRLHAARGRHGMADQRLGRAHEHATFPEDADEGERLDAIVLRGARAVGVDVADVGGRASGRGERVDHGANHSLAVRMGGGDVVGVRGHSRSEKLTRAHGHRGPGSDRRPPARGRPRLLRWTCRDARDRRDGRARDRAA